MYFQSQQDKQGICRRYPPSPLAIAEQNLLKGGVIEVNIRPYFPTMMTHGWCGEWQQRADQ